MTVTEQTQPLTQPLVADVYRDIHKGIRSLLFSTVSEAGRIDPSDRTARLGLAQQVSNLASLLESHAAHEDGFFQPVIEIHQPRLAEIVVSDHERFEVRFADITEMALTLGDGPADARFVTQQLYLELASFTGAYLQHQDLEERVVNPAIEAAIGADALRAIDQQLVASIPPQEMADALALMIPAMNVDDRTELLGGMKAGAPAEVFAGVWGLVGSVLTPAEVAQVAARLGLPA
jgi:iron-sulfur cluster repair protein YtfE (RIC family)